MSAIAASGPDPFLRRFDPSVRFGFAPPTHAGYAMAGVHVGPSAPEAKGRTAKGSRDVTDRLPSGMWVKAVLRAWFAQGRFGAVRHSGDPDTGMICVVLDAGFAGGRVLTLTRDIDGRLAWMRALGEGMRPREDIEAYIERARARDPDLWVVEFEDTDGLNPFEGREI